MKTIIAYASSHGTTEKLVQKIANSLTEDDVTVLNLKKQAFISVDAFDKVIIGGSIHAGSVQKSVQNFVSKNSDQFHGKIVGLFVCGMEPKTEKQTQELELAYPADLRQKAKISAFVGGEFLFEKMNFFEKLIIKKIAKTDKSVSALHNETIEKLIAAMK